MWYDDEISDEPGGGQWRGDHYVVNINHYSVFITLTLLLWPDPGCGVWCQHNQVITSCCSYTGNGRSRDTSLLSPCVEQSVWSREEQEGTPITGNGTEYWAQREQSIIFLPRRGNLITIRSSTHCLAGLASPLTWQLKLYPALGVNQPLPSPVLRNTSAFYNENSGFCFKPKTSAQYNFYWTVHKA